MIKDPLEGEYEKQSGYFMKIKHRFELSSIMQDEATRMTSWNFHLITKFTSSMSSHNL